MSNIRICKTCQHPKQRHKSRCHNPSCIDSLPYKNKQKEEEKERKRVERNKKKLKKEQEAAQKRVERQNKKKLRAPKAGTDVKARDGSTRHGFIISFGKYHDPFDKAPVDARLADINNKNKILGINNEVCFWCRETKRECGDHIHPCCNTTKHTYAWTNALSIFPSCRKCNSVKGGKSLEVWVKELPKLGWEQPDITSLINWLEENKDKLLLPEVDIKYVEKQFIEINKYHKLLDYCAKYRKHVTDFITYHNLPENF